MYNCTYYISMLGMRFCIMFTENPVWFNENYSKIYRKSMLDLYLITVNLWDAWQFCNNWNIKFVVIILGLTKDISVWGV